MPPDVKQKIIAVTAEYNAAQDEISRLEQFEDTAKYLKANNLDMSNRFDVNRLIQKLEGNRVSIMRSQLKIIKQVEDDLTVQMQAKGLLPPGRRFSFSQDLAPDERPGS
jgi:hypothetical protein